MPFGHGLAGEVAGQLGEGPMVDSGLSRASYPQQRAGPRAREYQERLRKLGNESSRFRDQASVGPGSDRPMAGLFHLFSVYLGEKARGPKKGIIFSVKL